MFRKLQGILLHVMSLLLLRQGDVDGGCLQVLVAQDFFERQNVGAHFVVVGSHGVTQGMDAGLVDASAVEIFIHRILDLPLRQPLAFF